jgi:hypothetical protein
MQSSPRPALSGNAVFTEQAPGEQQCAAPGATIATKQRMFDSIDQRGHTWRSYALHCLLGVVLTPLVGIADYRWTPIAGAMIAWVVARWAASRTAAYVWVPAVVLFAFGAADPIRSWSPSLSSMGRWEYFTDTMFGPNCQASECLYTIFTAVLSGAAAYSLAGWAMWRRRSRRAVSG